MKSLNVMGYSLCHLPTSCGIGGRGNVKAAGQQGQSAGPGLSGRGREDEAGVGW
ncbi:MULTISPECIES: hypothetical protein [Actinomyces]|uniref:hypothetical protein n=1 Tax=Actinomyces TaxID=1654 RepID=UPI0012FEE5C1|nr:MULTISPECIES: hypothetical protein [Actinomyces]